MKKSLNLNDIHFHDSILSKVEEIIEKDQIIFFINYPIDWENDKYTRKRLIFHDALNYRIEEGPFHGDVTLLDYNVVTDSDDRISICIGTNAGKRYISFSQIELVDWT